MSDQQALVNLVLSREELLVALRLLDADTIPGLDPDPGGEMSPDQLELALFVAGRALRARGLARLNEQGELALHQGMLTAVGTCAYAQNSLFALHWPVAGETPQRYFAHQRAGDIVSHRRPEDVLHLFTVLPTHDALVAQFFDVAQFADAAENGNFEFTIPADAFVQAREAGQDGDANRGTAVLTDAGAPADGARALAQTLSSTPRVTITQTLQQMAESVQKRDFTLLQTPDQSWLLVPATDEAEPATFLAKTTNRAEVAALLHDSLRSLLN